MKIKITEGQAKRLKLISENTDELSRFIYLCDVKVQEINKIYNKVSFITIAEILNHEVNMVEINTVLDKIEHDVLRSNNKAYASIKHLPEEGLDEKIDKAYEKVNSKLTPLQIVVLDLEKLQLAARQHDLTKPFK